MKLALQTPLNDEIRDVKKEQSMAKFLLKAYKFDWCLFFLCHLKKRSFLKRFFLKKVTKHQNYRADVEKSFNFIKK